MSKSILFLSFFLSLSAWAADPSLTNLTEKDFESVSKEFSSNFTHPSLTGAASYGDVLGFELALVAGQTPSPQIDDIAKRTSGNGLPNLYHAGLLLAVSVPFGLTGEVLYTPSYNANDVHFQATSLAAKLTLSKSLLVIPFNVAIRVAQSNSTLDFKQTTTGVVGTVENKNSVTAVQLIASPNLPVIEPYVGVGYLQAKNTLSVTGTGTVFNYTASQSQDTNLTSTQTILGLNLYVLMLSLGAEYSKAFDANNYTMKLGFAF